MLVDRDRSVLAAGGYLIQLLPGAGEDTICLLYTSDVYKRQALCCVILNAVLPGNDYVFGVSVEGDKSADLGSY